MVRRPKNSAEETAELQRLYCELPWAITEAAKAHDKTQQPDQAAHPLQEGDEKVDTIIKRIVQLSDALEDGSDD